MMSKPNDQQALESEYRAVNGTLVLAWLSTEIWLDLVPASQSWQEPGTILGHRAACQ